MAQRLAAAVSELAAALATKPEFAASSELRRLVVAMDLLKALDQWEALTRIAEEVTAEVLAEGQPTTKIFTIAHVPEALRQTWLQHLRDFDTAHPGCHFEVAADAPDMSLGEMVEQLQLTPGLTFQQIFERKP